MTPAIHSRQLQRRRPISEAANLQITVSESPLSGDIWQIGDVVTGHRLGRGIIVQNTPQITILVSRGARVEHGIEVRGSQSSLERLGWQREPLRSLDSRQPSNR